MAARIRKGDRVEVISGVSKGKRGEVMRVFPKEGRAIVQGINVVARHQKPRGVSQPGGVVRQEAALSLAKLALIDPKTDKPTRVGFRITPQGDKVRFARRSGTEIGG